MLAHYRPASRKPMTLDKKCMVGPVLAGPACLSAQKKEITAMFSSEQQKSLERKTYRIPACLSTEDKLIVLGPLSLTLRQAFILTLFGCLTVDLWRVSAILPAWGGLGFIIRLLLAALPAGTGLVLAFVSVSGRYLEVWGLVMIRYLIRPKHYRWQRLQDRQPPTHLRCTRRIRSRPTIVLFCHHESEDKE
jgi:hypothetical protein